MSRTRRGKKSPGHEHWSKRPGNRHGGVPGRDKKKSTHKSERQKEKKETREGIVEASVEKQEQIVENEAICRDAMIEMEDQRYIYEDLDDLCEDDDEEDFGIDCDDL